MRMNTSPTGADHGAPFAPHDGGSDPLNYISPEGVRWTTRNYGEALPGVPTPLTWSIWGSGLNFALMDILVRTGCLTQEEVDAVEASGLRTQALFYGQLAGNVDFLSQAFSRMPGINPVDFERYMFGIEPGPHTPEPDLSRAEIIAVKAEEARRNQRRRLDEVALQSETWWRHAVTAEWSPSAATTELADARQLFAEVMAIHGLYTPLAQEAYAAVAALAIAAGHPGAEAGLFAGIGQLEEARVVEDLWRVANNQMDLDDFLSHHGYHGPNEAELASASWREDSSPVVQSVAALRDEPKSARPSVQAQSRRLEASTHLDVMCGALNSADAQRFRDAVTSAAEVMACRERGKAAFLKVLDGARRLARVVGDEFARLNLIEADDVFFLTVDELLAGQVSREIVAERRAKRLEYQAIKIPGNWTGNPEPIPAEAPEKTHTGAALTGLPASGGIAEGIARVIHDPSAVDTPLGPDEILVARTTDPGWVSLFMRAGAIVVDIGTAMSHAAIIARELGIPCVVNTGEGTARLADGARLKVDGGTGVVLVLQRT
jgi:phosphohistidine swiveling domain-containing protein